VGQLSHDHHLSLGGYAANALPLLAGWFALACGTRRFLPTWLAGVTLGVVVRMIALGHYRWNQLAFLLVSLAFVGAVAGAVVTLAHLVRGSNQVQRSG
jgi:hypothetical protein